MVTDHQGVEIKIGDKVFLPCKVIRMTDTPVYANLTVQPIVPMPPHEKSHLEFEVNSKQVEKEAAD